MFRLIVGLGNPGLKYRHTPHNVGFEVVDLLSDRCGAEFRANKRFRADLASVRIAGRETILMRPQTFMNLSGEAAGRFARYKAVAAEEILVVCDDIDLPMGRVRLRSSGGAGGHKGLASLIAVLESNEFARLRIGIDPGEPVDDLTSYVLTPWWGEMREAMQSVCGRATDAVERALEGGLDQAMSEFNGKDVLEFGDQSPGQS